MGGQSKQPAELLNNLAGRKPSAGRRFLVVFRNGLEKLHFPTVSYTQGCHGTQCQVGNRKPWEAEAGRATGRALVPGAEKPGTARETAVTFFVGVVVGKFLAATLQSRARPHAGRGLPDEFFQPHSGG